MKLRLALVIVFSCFLLATYSQYPCVTNYENARLIGDCYIKNFTMCGEYWQLHLDIDGTDVTHKITDITKLERKELKDLRRAFRKVVESHKPCKLLKTQGGTRPPFCT